MNDFELGDKVEFDTVVGWDENQKQVVIQGIYLGADKHTTYIAMDRKNWAATHVMGRPNPWEPMKLRNESKLRASLRKVEEN